MSKVKEKDFLLEELDNLEVNGVISIGAKKGEFAGAYHKLGIHKVLWIEKDISLYNELYQNASKYALKHNFLMNEVSNKTADNTTTFKSLWRENAAYIDIESYDMIHFDISENIQECLEGFENFQQGFRVITTSKEISSSAEEYIESLGYVLTEFVENQKLFVK